MDFERLPFNELHALLAGAKGIPVKGITLFAFGGISRTHMEAETPGDKFQTEVGPLTRLGLTVLFELVRYVN